MLVLSRKLGESIIIGDQIELVVVSVEKDVVRLGIKAPKHMPIFRKELYDLLKESNEEASKSELKPEQFKNLLKKKEE
ncbi:MULTISPECIES: carbon storage regulator CsrA [unclassified Paenibacillus]|uniref:carbon storage regulator CsrA n=1 Tax=unclassified Paenibacillus TaxID=185978 RepID=UPI001AEA9B6B|nr:MULTISPECIES: carbon storage regulator CsrA [unclassified Paenibacillus]MBP1157802.1 carbon storage regulator [Paenibacillus sp. PvP091]MBP1171462.1 carbon storage regulator [Paenibacillus sp. PvR098]MBP2442490.1 carbon storage regulator [Paenibacillus sp. PvP052]